ncbi:MAG TPA: nicotinate phosphoribosyltransferase [Pilimelia sp.]|nr:nicotinate phosphoribosyltransferase [Pilimelia sp.]
MSGLLTDLYEVRMAASYCGRAMVGPATFSLFVRRLPRQRGFLVAAGLGECLRFLQGFRFTAGELDYLAGIGMPEVALRALRGMRFTGDVWAVPEGRVVFASEPLLEVTAPIAEAQLVETMLLNAVTFETAVASKAARCRLAAGQAELIDFAFRRCHGVDAALAVARASAIAGFEATSNVEAARRYGLRAAGTMAHSYVEAFVDERAAFAAFAHDFPAATVFLVDTYDTLSGVANAVRVARDLDLDGDRLAVRLDSGDLAELAVATRRLLDDEGLALARIVASGGLDEYAIAELVARGAPIDAYGVGTRMGVSADAPYLDTAYKLVAYGDRPVMKLSTGKVSLPGRKQVYRGRTPGEDLIALRDEPAPNGMMPLLVPVIRAGRRVAEPADRHGPPDDVAAARRRCAEDLDRLPVAARRLGRPEAPTPGPSPALRRLATQLAAELAPHAIHQPRERHCGAPAG